MPVRRCLLVTNSSTWQAAAGKIQAVYRGRAVREKQARLVAGLMISLKTFQPTCTFECVYIHSCMSVCMETGNRYRVVVLTCLSIQFINTVCANNSLSCLYIPVNSLFTN